MGRIIHTTYCTTLRELAAFKGDLAVFGLPNQRSKLLLAIVNSLDYKGSTSRQGANLAYWGQGALFPEYWKLEARGAALELFPPVSIDGVPRVRFKKAELGQYQKNPFCIGSAAATDEKVKWYLSQRGGGFEYYAHLLDQGRFVRERGLFEKLGDISLIARPFMQIVPRFQ